ncbi:hypothetical protein [Clostridium cibarium]|uniref:Uncharacterized protein n=1 Tax=Clostridium cibarium TaxID=2762247 RepID=A0ABR8PXB0_9CLOT|nr:hypothetical protein [Clostridium cibarium]MBD7912779.1 hypothetical protein [Clostridium cibarium]
MTAEIAILNKTGVALATDSVATVDIQGVKKFITVEKLFNISENHPVGIMFYDNPDLTDIPCETIIKVYKTSLKDKYFDTLQEYADDFLSFLSKNRKVYNSGYEKRLVKSVLDYCLMENIPKQKSVHNRKETLRKNVEENLKYFSSMRCLSGFNDNFVELFLETHGEYLKKYMNEIDNIRIDRKTQENIVLLCAHIISKSDCLFRSTKRPTNIVIAGYGNKEIFPSIIEYKITGVISGTLIYELVTKVEVGLEESDVEATFIPFAQRDVVDTYTKGIDTELENTIFNKTDTIFNNFFEAIQDAIQSESNANLAHEFSSEEIDILKRLGKKLNKEIKDDFELIQKEKYTKPFSDMVTFLGKEEMIFLAEALVNLTSTRRRFTTDLESVGGSTDVVIITKVDGFKWVKKKTIFKT